MRIESETTSLPDDERSLDRLLNAARWPDSDSASMARLRITLAAESHRVAAKSEWRWGVVIAASVAIALIGGAIILEPRNRPASPTQLITVAVTPTVSPIRARPANEYECAILLANSMTHSTVKPVPISPPVNPPAAIAASPRKNDPAALLAQNNPASIEKYLQLVQDASTHDAALDALRASDDPPVHLLLAELNAPLVFHRYAAARALGCLCHGPTFAALKQRIERNVDRREAMIALLFCPNPAAKEYLDELRTRPVLREMLISAQAQSRDIF